MNMASSSSSPLLLMIIFSMSLLISCSESTEYLLGDSHNSWKVPLPSRGALAHWASAYEFTVGDTIRFEYDNETESVHEVDEHDYIMCHTNGDQHVEHHDGNTTVVLDKIGVYHFISGTKRHCKMGLKLAVIVKNKHDLVLPPLITMPMPPSPSPSPNSSGNKGGGGAGLGFIMWLGVSLVMMIFLI